MNDFRELNVWKKSRCLLLLVYKITEIFPNNKFPGLTNQLRNSCVDILANITRAFSVKKYEEITRFLQSSIGSVKKLELQIRKAYDHHFINNLDYGYLNHKTKEISKLLKYSITNLKTES